MQLTREAQKNPKQNARGGAVSRAHPCTLRLPAPSPVVTSHYAACQVIISHLQHVDRATLLVLVPVAGVEGDWASEPVSVSGGCWPLGSKHQPGLPK